MPSVEKKWHWYLLRRATAAATAASERPAATASQETRVTPVPRDFAAIAASRLALATLRGCPQLPRATGHIDRGLRRYSLSGRPQSNFTRGSKSVYATSTSVFI